MANKTYKKVKSLLLIILSCLMAVCVFTALFPKHDALADRSVTISGSSIFYTSAEAEVWAHEEEYDEKTQNPEYFSMFVFKHYKGKQDVDSVNYRKHLAFKWYENSAEEYVPEDTEDDEEPTASIIRQDGWFNMEIGFESYTFKKFIITFESQQYVQTKDGKTTNYIVFYPKDTNSDGEPDGVQAVIGGNTEDEPNELDAVFSGHIYINFIGAIVDGYELKVSDEHSTADEATYTTGEFNNIGGTYSRYSSSQTTPVTPLSFKAEFEKQDGEDDDDETYDSDYARMVLYRLNNQSFRLGTYKKVEIFNEEGELNLGKDADKNDIKFEDVYQKYYVLKGREYVRCDDPVPSKDVTYYNYTPGVHTEDGHWRGGTVNDNAPPVICFTNGITHVGVGSELPFDYQLIDVLASSPSADTYYYMLTTEQTERQNFKPDNYADEKLFRMVTDSDNQYMEPHKGHYTPTADEIGIYDEENFKVVAAVKVYLKLYDTRTTGINQTAYVLLDWFIPEEKLVEVKSLEGKDNKFIAVANDEIGVSFAYTSFNDETQQIESHTDDEDWLAIVDAYQKLVTEAAKDIKAGSKNYFYLPSLENIKYTDSKGQERTDGRLLSDNVTAYKDLSFNVYYNNGSNGNTTTQKSNSLAINLTKAGRYIFTIYATDKKSNPMYYYKEEGGKFEKKTFTASNIWSMRDSKKNTEYADTKDYLPWFTFNVDASEISIEDPGEREAAFVGTKYTSISFDINAVSFERKYELYRFDNDVYFNDYSEDGGKGSALTYEQFMKNKAEYLENHPEWFTEIPAAKDLTAGSDEYDDFHDYAWNNTSPEFVPQDANTFYIVKLTVTSTVDNLEPKMAYMGISASAKISSLKGEDTWLKDNMTSIILLSIAGASLIGIILLLVIKPKNKGDIDEQFEAIKPAKSKKSKKKSK